MPLEVAKLRRESARQTSEANEKYGSASTERVKIEQFLKENRGGAFTAEEIYQALYPNAQYNRSRMVQLEYDIIPLLSKGTVEYKPHSLLSNDGGSNKNEIEMYYYYNEDIE